MVAEACAWWDVMEVVHDVSPLVSTVPCIAAAGCGVVAGKIIGDVLVTLTRLLIRGVVALGRVVAYIIIFSSRPIIRIVCSAAVCLINRLVRDPLPEEYSRPQVVPSVVASAPYAKDVLYDVKDDGNAKRVRRNRTPPIASSQRVSTEYDMKGEWVTAKKHNYTDSLTMFDDIVDVDDGAKSPDVDLTNKEDMSVRSLAMKAAISRQKQNTRQTLRKPVKRTHLWSRDVIGMNSDVDPLYIEGNVCQQCSSPKSYIGKQGFHYCSLGCLNEHKKTPEYSEKCKRNESIANDWH